MIPVGVVPLLLSEACLAGTILSAAGWWLLGRLGVRRARPRALRVAAALAAAFLFFAGAEGFLRWMAGPDRGPWPTEHGVVMDRLFLYRLRKNWSGMWSGVRVQTNSLGLRGPEVAPRRPGELRILCLGDSVTFGAHTSYEDSYPSLLQERLRQVCGPRPVTVINAGIPGYNAYLGARLLEEIGPVCQPDLVLVAFFGNDRVSRLSYRSWSRQATVLRLREALARSEFYTALCAMLQSLAGPRPPGRQRSGEEASSVAAYRDNLQ
ncbi:MAG TPA: GDSL-type esterase/lipase family protein, partial [Candidatus Nitrosotenuis sp.]|nr:GDSL-type esterase/lipase family protein [Candidatus Nitrosotenuis sp.]